MDLLNRQQLGKIAERKACEYLKKQGLLLIQQNYSCYSGEIDLIMQDKEDIVFVEVRARHNTERGNALESIGPRKINCLLKAATRFLQEKKWLYQKNSRFDVIAFHPIAGKMHLEWFKNAFTIDRYW